MSPRHIHFRLTAIIRTVFESSCVCLEYEICDISSRGAESMRWSAQLEGERVGGGLGAGGGGRGGGVGYL